MKGLIIFIFALAAAIPMEAQNSWASIGDFNTLTGVDLLWYDSVDQRLYAAGTYTWFDSSEVHGFGYIQGDTVIGLGCGFEACGIQAPYNSAVPKVTGFARYQGELYVTGYFARAGGVTVNGIAKWDGSDWGAVGRGFMMDASINAAPGIGYGLEVMNGELYAYGLFDSINGIAANSLAKFDGTSWSAVFDLPRFGASPSDVNMIFDAEWFGGELYVGGNFNEPGPNIIIRDLVKWDGIDWVAVGAGLTGGATAIGKLLIWDGKLLISGGFSPRSSPGGIPGKNIVLWDGQNWDTLRGGVTGEIYGTGGVLTVQEHKGELYVAGTFDYAGDVPAKNFAKWDGTEWCGLDATDFYLRSFAFLDDTLFISYAWGYISPDSSVKDVVKWTGGPWEGDFCQGPVAVDPTVEVEERMELFPNPIAIGSASSSFQLGFPEGVGSCEIKISDITGRTVMQPFIYRSGSAPVNVEQLPAGIYLVQVRVKDRVQTVKFIKQ
jgi:hypothetical protein